MSLKQRVELIIRESLKLPADFKIEKGRVTISEGVPGIEFEAVVSNEKHHQEIIPFAAPMERSPKKKKTSPKKSPAPAEPQKISDAQIKAWRAILQNRKWLKKLTPEQERALDSLKGIKAADLNQIQREQIRQIYLDSN